MRIVKQTTPWSWWIGAALLTWVMPTSVEAQIDVRIRSVTMEIIIKFSDDSDPGGLVAGFIEENSQDLSELSEIGGELHASTGVVYTPERVTSGRELIVAVPEKPIMEQIRAVVVEQSEVSAAEIVATQSENPRLAQYQLLVSFRQLSDEAELVENADGNDALAERVQSLATELCAPSGVPVRGVAISSTTLAVIVDRFALLEKLVMQLRSLDYVEYAQPNATVQFVN